MLFTGDEGYLCDGIVPGKLLVSREQEPRLHCCASLVAGKSSAGRAVIRLAGWIGETGGDRRPMDAQDRMLQLIHAAGLDDPVLDYLTAVMALRGRMAAMQRCNGNALNCVR